MKSRVRSGETEQTQTMTENEPSSDGERPGEELLSAGPDEVLCRECWEALGQITGSHLSLHGMTTEEYRKSHPGAKLAPDSVRSRTGWTEKHDEDTRRRISDAVQRRHREGFYDAR
jgi:hypothetical protein